MLERAGERAEATVVAAVGGLALGLIASGGIVEERLTLGRVSTGLFVNVFVSLAALMAIRLSPPRTRASQACGAGLGILLVHVALHLHWIASAPWLAERPTQLVNDVVAVLATLGLVWGLGRRFDPRLLLGAAGLLTLYRLTRGMWHVDVPPRAFAVAVQDLVVAQCVAVAVALLVFRGQTEPG